MLILGMKHERDMIQFEVGSIVIKIKTEKRNGNYIGVLIDAPKEVRVKRPQKVTEAPKREIDEENFGNH